MFRAIFTVILLFSFAPGPLPAQTRDYAWFLRRLIDLDSLCVQDDQTVMAQASSYDRTSRYDEASQSYLGWEANGDAGHYIAVDQSTGEAVMADLKGPGCIVRIWSANPQGRIRFYLDGETTPSYDFDFKELFMGKIEPFSSPFVWVRGEGGRASDCYLPIPYAKSCRVTADKAYQQYYHIGYQSYAPGVGVETFRLPLSESAKAALEEVRQAWQNLGTQPQPRAEMRAKGAGFRVGAGQTTELLRLQGPKTICALKIYLHNDDLLKNRSVLLRVIWDDASDSGIEAPLCDFFGPGFGKQEYLSLPMGIRRNRGYCYFRMPFRESARFYIVNEGNQPIDVGLDVHYVDGIPDRFMYFCAKWQRDKDGFNFEYPFLETAGGGRFVGATLSVDNLHGGWWGEGDEKFYLNNEKFPSTFGTGSEDYFGDAWGIRAFQNPLHGCLDFDSRKQTCYRWHIPDSVPFTAGCRLTIENYSAMERIHNDYASVTYWYTTELGADTIPDTRAPQRKPLPEVVTPGALEVEIEPPSAGVAELVEDKSLSMGGGIRLRGTAGAAQKLHVIVQDDDIYSLQCFSAPGVPADVSVLLDGKPIAERVRLRPGTNNIELSLKSESQEGVVLDYVLATPIREFVRRFLVIGPFENLNGAGLATVYPPEQGVNSAASMTGKSDKQISWKLVETATDGVLNFKSIFEDNQDSVAYATFAVESPTDRLTDMLLGSDDGVRVWHNESLIWDNPIRRALSVDQDRIPLSLVKGENRFLIKVEQGGGDWSLAVRILDPERSLTYRTPVRE